MPLVSDWKPTDPIQVLVFGEFKTGKSWGAFTFPRPVVFDYDKGIATARNPEFVAKYGRRWIWYDTFEDTERNKQGIVTRHTGFDQACMCFDEWMKPKGKWKNEEVGRDMFDTFVIDSGTTLSLLAMSKAAIVLGSQKLSHTQEQAASSGILVPKQQDYGAERSLVEQFVRMVKSSGKNVVFICHEKDKLSADGQTITDIVPLLTGKSAELIPLMFDEVYNLRVKPKGTGVFRYLQTQPDALRRCGSRYGIPNETAWEYDALKKEIDRIHAEQNKVSTEVVGAVALAGTVLTTIK